ncbi:hypothetical protein P9112_009591 [Eukaryota sp. TZLM1-RC]
MLPTCLHCGNFLALSDIHSEEEPVPICPTCAPKSPSSTSGDQHTHSDNNFDVYTTVFGSIPVCDQSTNTDGALYQDDSYLDTLQFKLKSSQERILTLEKELHFEKTMAKSSVQDLENEHKAIVAKLKSDYQAEITKIESSYKEQLEKSRPSPTQVDLIPTQNELIQELRTELLKQEALLVKANEDLTKAQQRLELAHLGQCVTLSQNPDLTRSNPDTTPSSKRLAKSNDEPPKKLRNVDDLELEDLVNMLEALPTARDKVLLILSVHLPISVAKLVELRARDVFDYENKTLVVYKIATKRRKQFLDLSKMADVFKDFLIDYLLPMPPQGFVLYSTEAMKGSEDRKPVYDRHLAQGTVWTLFKNAAKKANIEGRFSRDTIKNFFDMVSVDMMFN